LYTAYCDSCLFSPCNIFVDSCLVLGVVLRKRRAVHYCNMTTCKNNLPLTKTTTTRVFHNSTSLFAYSPRGTFYKHLRAFTCLAAASVLENITPHPNGQRCGLAPVCVKTCRFRSWRLINVISHPKITQGKSLDLRSDGDGRPRRDLPGFFFLSIPVLDSAAVAATG
jgi:hypothetical protein